jgi:transposase
MPKRITVVPHLSPAELEQRYRKASDSVERTHFQILWQIARGARTEAVAEMTGYTSGWIRRLVRRYNSGGPQAMGDRRHQLPGAAPLLSPEQQEALRTAIASGPAPDGGLWSCRQVAAWIAQETARAGPASIPVQRGWVYLRRLGLSPQVPRPRHRKQDTAAQEAFKKGD